MKLNIAALRQVTASSVEIRLSDGSRQRLPMELADTGLLRAGLVLEESTLRAIEQARLLIACQRKADRLLAGRPHAAMELLRKLKSGDRFPSPVVNAVLARLLEGGRLNDDSFARVFAAELLRKGLGRSLIAQRLRARGLSRATVEAALAALHTDPEEQTRIILALAGRKMAILRKDTDAFKKRQQLTRFLASRGFSSSQISAHIDSIIANHKGGPQE